MPEGPPKPQRTRDSGVFGINAIRNLLAKRDKRESGVISLDKIRTSEQFLEVVDFGLINSILGKIQRKSGIPDEAVVQIPREAVQISTKQNSRKGTSGSFHFSVVVSETEEIPDRMRGKIVLEWDSINAGSRMNGLHAWKELLHALNHEAAHYASYLKQPATSAEDRRRHREKVLSEERLAQLPDGAVIDDVTTGFQESRDLKDGSYAIIGISLNEAVTEKIAQEITAEYLRSSGLAQKAKTHHSLDEVRGGYHSERKMLDALILTMAHALSVEPELVWRAIVRCYFSGEQKVEDFIEMTCAVLADSVPWEQLDTRTRKSLLATIAFMDRSRKGSQTRQAYRQFKANVPKDVERRIYKLIEPGRITVSDAKRIGATLGLS